MLPNRVWREGKNFSTYILHGNCEYVENFYICNMKNCKYGGKKSKKATRVCLVIESSKYVLNYYILKMKSGSMLTSIKYVVNDSSLQPTELKESFSIIEVGISTFLGSFPV